MIPPTEPHLPRRTAAAWRQMQSVTLALLVALAIPTTLARSAGAQEVEQVVTTQHQIILGGQTLRYTARAGLLPIRDNEAGDTHAHIFFVAYTLDRAPGQPQRPLMFLWNGGPGMNSSLIHLLGFGPKRVKTGDVYATSPPLSETEMVDNQETWLDWADLVFVDPVGTGYSRPTKAEYAGEFYQTRGDAEAVTEFIRLYKVRFDAWHAPLFIVGHSYGTTRAMAMAEMLVRRGIDLKGVALLSGGFSVGQDPLPAGFDTALTLPGMTAAAFYHKK
jgi:carboxypeptidase C (cathepsin A)